jgi:hypothetical protein
MIGGEPVVTATGNAERSLGLAIAQHQRPDLLSCPDVPLRVTARGPPSRGLQG